MRRPETKNTRCKITLTEEETNNARAVYIYTLIKKW